MERRLRSETGWVGYATEANDRSHGPHRPQRKHHNDGLANHGFLISVPARHVAEDRIAQTVHDKAATCGGWGYMGLSVPAFMADTCASRC